jgi:sucrose-6-phosphate hydrolase SacC (GH32 family)
MPFNQQMSFPCEMTLRSFPEGLRICRQPVKEIETLHDKVHTWTNLVVKPGDNPLTGITGDLFDIRAEIDAGKETEFCFTIRGEKLTYSAKKKELMCRGATAPVEPVNGKISLQILVDRTSIEVFAQEGTHPMTSCFLPEPGNREIAFSVSGEEVKITALTVYELKSAWSD